MKLHRSCFILLYISQYALSKEIVATDEWTLVQEGETIPAGLHVRIDFQTGGKWVKRLTETSEPLSSQAVVTQQNVRITQLTDTSLSSEDSHRISQKIQANKIESISKLNDFSKDEDEADYMTMYRTLLSLPLDEQERMGGIPQLPTNLDDDRTALQEFVQKISNIWAQRQEELKEVQEMMVDSPKWMQQQILYMQDFIHNSSSHLYDLYQAQTISNELQPPNILSTLYDLELQVCDLDMARDFHTLGGWPLVVSLLLLHPPTSDDLGMISAYNLSNNRTQSFSSDIDDSSFILSQTMDILTWEIQALASWVIGSSVKNIHEFHPWALEDLTTHLLSYSFSKPFATSRTSQTEYLNNITVIDVLLSTLASIPSSSTISTHGNTVLQSGYNMEENWQVAFLRKRQKELYAIGSILRGNPLAVERFLHLDGPWILVQASDYASALQAHPSPTLNKHAAGIKSKVHNLAQDLILNFDLEDSHLASLIEDLDDKDNAVL